jgi:hypothetical protein
MGRTLGTVGLAAVLVAASGLGASGADGAGLPVIETIEIPELDGWLFSPDGSLVAGVIGEVRHPETWCVHELPSGAQRWCIDAAPGGDPLALSPAWLPDGSGLVLSEDFPAEADLWRIDARTGATTDLTDDGRAGRLPELEATARADAPLMMDVFPSVSPDGASIAFMRIAMTGPDTASPSLQLMPAGGGAPAQVVPLGQILMEAPVWSRDGRWLHWVELGGYGVEVIGSASPDGTESRRIHVSADPAVEFLPDRLLGALADGRLLMVDGCWGFVGCSSWLVDPVTGAAEPLIGEWPEDPAVRLFAVAVSPDGRTVAALTRRDDVVQLELIDPATRAVHAIPLPDLRATRSSRVHWLTDGRILVGGDEYHPRRVLAITLPEDVAAAP